MLSGGTADWGRQLPIGNEVRTVCYSADLMTRLYIDDTHKYMRTVFIGMDKVQPADGTFWGDDSGGFGHFRMADVASGDTLIGHIDWRVEDGQDYGTFHFDEGHGYWKGVSGALTDVRLDWCTKRSEDSIGPGEPVTLLAFIEGIGSLSFPE
jgi:hypothetical protein